MGRGEDSAVGEGGGGGNQARGQGKGLCHP